MKPTFAIVLIATLAFSACSRTRPETSVQAAVSGERTVEAATPLYAPIDANAKDGEVFEYY